MKNKTIKNFGFTSFKTCKCGLIKCNICNPDGATKLIFHTTNKKKTYTLKPTKKQLKSLKFYWKLLQEVESQFYKSVNFIEEDMVKVTGIKGVEFFLSEDGYYCGIGNADRTIGLIHATELEKK